MRSSYTSRGHRLPVDQGYLQLCKKQEMIQDLDTANIFQDKGLRGISLKLKHPGDDMFQLTSHFFAYASEGALHSSN